MLEDLKALDEILMRSNARPTEYNPIMRRLYTIAETTSECSMDAKDEAPNRGL